MLSAPLTGQGEMMLEHPLLPLAVEEHQEL